MSFNLNAAGLSDLHVHINVNFTSFLHNIFRLDKNNREKLGEGIRGERFEELAEVSSTRLFLNKEIDWHAVVQDKLYAESQSKEGQQSVF